jgi:hypothetical protein
MHGISDKKQGGEWGNDSVRPSSIPTQTQTPPRLAAAPTSRPGFVYNTLSVRSAQPFLAGKATGLFALKAGFEPVWLINLSPSIFWESKEITSDHQ